MTGLAAAAPPGVPRGEEAGRARREAWRRAVHAASGLLGLVAARLSARQAGALFVLVVLAAVGAEVARRTWPRFRGVVERVAGDLFRPAEQRGLSGAATLAVGYAVTWWVFPAAAATPAILVAAIADPIAATVGSQVPGGGRKTWAGTAACACAAALVLLPTGAPPAAVVAAALVAAAAERAPWRGSDNLTVPIAVAGVLWVLA